MQPSNETELSEAIRDTAGPVRIRGGGTRPIGRAAAGAVLHLAGLSGVRLYEPGALTLVVGAGTPLAEVEAALAAENQRLPFEPADWRGLLSSAGEPTIGGVVAGNISGPRRVQAGAARDSLIGVRFVDGTGTVVKNGGRVMKNVTGYDLVKLMAGSWGTLGVLSEVSFKVLPAPGAAATIRVPGLDVAAGVAALTAALTSPYDVTGAAWTAEAGALIRIEGFAESIRYRSGRLHDLMQAHGAPEIVGELAECEAIWTDVRDVAAFHGRPGDVWRISVKPGDAPDLVARLGGEVMLDWGGGLIWALLPDGTDARSRLGNFSGHATLIRAEAATRAAVPTFHPEPAPVAALTSALRARFDPRGILNPGLMS
jgi:glycolate oxidase FAD binding subunit